MQFSSMAELHKFEFQREFFYKFEFTILNWIFHPIKMYRKYHLYKDYNGGWWITEGVIFTNNINSIDIDKVDPPLINGQSVYELYRAGYRKFVYVHDYKKLFLTEVRGVTDK